MMAIAGKLKRASKRTAAHLLPKTGWFRKHNDLLKDLRGKRVAVVGNARALADARLGEDIDRHDIIIRFNRAPMPGRLSHGSKTDWMAVGLAVERDLVRSRGAGCVLWISPFRELLTLSMLLDRNMYIQPVEDYNRLTRILGKRPSSGLVMLDMLERSDCTSVDIYGFDFFRSLSLSGDVTKEMTSHNFDAEERFFEELSARDMRFRLVRPGTSNDSLAPVA